MTYEDERGVSGRLAADDGYGTPPESYGGQQREPMASDRRDERGEPGQGWQGAPAQEGSGAADQREFEYWPSTQEPAGLPTAGRPPAEVAAALDYGAGSGRPRPGGLHAPLPAGENAYVDWIKGLGTADAAQEEWANAGPRDFDADGDAAGDWPDGDATDPDADGEPGAPVPEWTSTAEPAGGSPAGDEENWFEPKPRPEHSGQGAAEPFAAAPPASGTASEEENWFEPKLRNAAPEYPRAAIAAQSAAPSFAPPPAAMDWPRSAEELDFVTPEQAAGTAGFGAAAYRGGEYPPTEYPPTEYRGGGYDEGGYGGGYDGGGYDGFGAAGQGNRDEPQYPAADYPAEYGDDRAGEYDAGEYRGSYDEAPEDRAVAHLDDAETTVLPLGGGRNSAQRRTSRSYRPFAIAAGVVVAATVGVVGVALHDSSAQSANPDPPVSTGTPAAPPTDTALPDVPLPPPVDSATASPPPSMPTTAPTTRSRPVRTTSAPRPTQTRRTTPPPTPTHTQTPPTKPPTTPPTTTPPATGTATPTPTDTTTPN
jgi:hypothetical protein